MLRSKMLLILSRYCTFSVSSKSCIPPNQAWNVWVAASRTVVVRRFSCSTRLRSSKSEEDTATSWPSAIWLGSNASPNVAQKIVSQLPKLDSSKHKSLDTVIFLATPSFAELFEGSTTFHKDAINRLYGSFESTSLPTSIIAIVDAVPGVELIDENAGSRTSNQQPVYEGLAMCICPGSLISTAQSGSVETHYVQFQKAVKGGERTALYQVPVANTLFLNGRQSTLFSQPWSAPHDANPLEAISQPWIGSNTSRQYLDILKLPFLPDFKLGQDSNLELHTPLTPITPPRRISNSMGNVLRGIELEDGSSTPASSELEKVVPPYIKKHSLTHPNGSLRVYALTYSSDLTTSSDIDHKSGNESREENDLWEKIRQGGTLHRVTSGGGGWGNKQGLLSLEPATSFNEPADDYNPFLSSYPESDTVELPRTKDLFPVRNMIQFFACFEAPPEAGSLKDIKTNGADLATWDSIDAKSSKSDSQPSQRLIIGTTLGINSGDTISPTKVEDVTGEATINDNEPDIIYLPHQFGMITTGPIAYCSTRTSTETTTTKPEAAAENHQSLIDVPNAVFSSVSRSTKT